MTRYHRWVVTIGAIATVATISGCGHHEDRGGLLNEVFGAPSPTSSPPPPPPRVDHVKQIDTPQVEYFEAVLPDGQTAQCLRIPPWRDSPGALSCWPSRTQPQTAATGH